MTTIICTREAIIADRQHTHGGYKSPMTKLFALTESVFIGMSGDPSNFFIALEWLRDWSDSENTEDMIDRPLNISDDFEALMVSKVGIFLLGPQLSPYLLEVPFYAIGSGSSFALAALQLGKTLPEALQFAADNDIYTSHDYDLKKIPNE